MQQSPFKDFSAWCNTSTGKQVMLKKGPSLNLVTLSNMLDLVPSSKNSCLLTIVSGAVCKTAGVPVFSPVNVHSQSFFCCWHVQQGVF